jgi:hypothetical protein
VSRVNQHAQRPFVCFSRFFNQSCAGCACDLGTDAWMWDESYSAWTDVNFTQGISMSDLNSSIRAGWNDYCPDLRSPEWATRPTFCFADAATHLSYGLREVYENIFYHPTATGVRPYSAGIPQVGCPPPPCLLVGWCSSSASFSER